MSTNKRINKIINETKVEMNGYRNQNIPDIGNFFINVSDMTYNISPIRVNDRIDEIEKTCFAYFCSENSCSVNVEHLKTSA